MKIKTRRYYIYYLLRIATFIISIIPIKLGLLLADFAGRIGFAFAGKERERTLESLRRAFPEKSDVEIKKIAREVFFNLFKNGIELFNIYKLNPKTLPRWVKTEGFEKVDRALSKGKGVIMLSGHFGNWELVSFYFSLKGYSPSIIARKIYFNKYDDFINNIRNSKGVNVIYRDEPPRKILRALKDNRPIGILADQDVDSIDGVFVDFFGRPAYTPKGPVSISLASGAPIIPFFIVREKGCHKLIIEDAIEPAKTGNKEETIKATLQKWSHLVELYIKKYPSQWVWMHKRWKTKPEDLAK